MIKSWKTTILGVIAIGFGLWLMHVRYVPSNTLRFNLVYVWPESFSLIFAGIGLVHAKDHDK